VANLVVVLLVAAGFGFQFLTRSTCSGCSGFDSLTTGLAFLPAPVLIAPSRCCCPPG